MFISISFNPLSESKKISDEAAITYLTNYLDYCSEALLINANGKYKGRFNALYTVL